jgi:hypothetical protein
MLRERYGGRGDAGEILRVITAGELLRVITAGEVLRER